MSKFDNTILIENIKLQMKKHNESQKDVAEAIGMSQPNFNKAINQKGSKLFTLEQLYSISQHFGVGIDTLLGNEITNELSASAICSFIRQLIDNSIVDIVKVKYADTQHFLQTNEYYGQVEVVTDTTEEDYNALVFPNKMFKDRHLNPEEAYELKELFASAGNQDHRNELINEFVRKYFKMYLLCLKDDLDAKTLEVIYRNYIDEIIAEESIDDTDIDDFSFF